MSEEPASPADAEAPPAPSRLGQKLVLATVLGAVVFAALSLYGDVAELGRTLGSFPFELFGLALALATANYGIRFLRWQYYLRILGVEVPAGESALVFLAGFVMSVTPGKVGEVLKSWLLHESRGVSIARTAPIVVAERLTDLFALVLLTAVGSLAFERGRPVAVVGALVVVGLWITCAFRPVGELALRVSARLPGLRRLTPKLREAYESLRGLVQPGALALATGLSVFSWGLECVALWVIARGFEGLHLDLVQATFAYAAPTIVGAVAMMPGGLGVTEAGMTGTLQALGGASVTATAATAATILVRLATLWWAVLLGVLALAVFRRRFGGRAA